MALQKEEKQKQQKRKRRTWRVRARIHGTHFRPRLSVFHSHKHTYAQLIDDVSGKTIVGIGDTKKDSHKSKLTKTVIAREVGKEIAKAALRKGIRRAVFDRSHYAYHGRAKAVAEGAREGGLIL